MLYNTVLIKPDDDYTQVGNWAFRGGGTAQVSVYGTVLAVPKKIVCYSDRVWRNVSLGNRGWTLGLARMYTSISSAYKTKMELKVGDRVLFSYAAKTDEDTPEIEFKGQKCLAIGYEMIYAVRIPWGWRPVNGYLLVRILQKRKIEEVVPGFALEHTDVNKYGVGVVDYAGKPNKGYLYERMFDDGRIKKGMLVCFDMGQAARIEQDIHNYLNPEKQSSYFRVHRKNVLTWTK